MPEKLRVAVASSQGREVDLHFGHADQFLVFDILPHQVEFIDARKVPAEEDDMEGVEDLDRVVELVSDCQYVVSRRAGPHAVERLSGRGIRSVEHVGSLVAGLQELRSLVKAA